MFIKNRLASVIYKLALIIICLIGILFNTGMLNGSFVPYILLYYSVISNIVCLIFFIVSAIVTARAISRRGPYGPVRMAPHFKGAIVMSMVLTMLLFLFTIMQSSFASASLFVILSNVVMHLIVPLMVILDWALFDKKGRFFPSDPIIWLVIPIGYYMVLLLGAQFGVTYFNNASYPYYFLDPNQISWAPVLVNIFIISLVYMALGYMLLGVDRLLGSQAKKRALYALEEAESQPDSTPEDAVPAPGTDDSNPKALSVAPPVAPAVLMTQAPSSPPPQSLGDIIKAEAASAPATTTPHISAPAILEEKLSAPAPSPALNPRVAPVSHLAPSAGGPPSKAPAPVSPVPSPTRQAPPAYRANPPSAAAATTKRVYTPGVTSFATAATASVAPAPAKSDIVRPSVVTPVPPQQMAPPSLADLDIPLGKPDP